MLRYNQDSPQGPQEATEATHTQRRPRGGSLPRGTGRWPPAHPFLQHTHQAQIQLPGGDCVQGKSEMASGRFQPPHKDAPTDGGRSRGQATPSSWLGLRLPGLSGIFQNCLSAFLAPTSHLPCKVGKPGTEQGHLSRGCPPGRGLWHRQPLRVTTKGGGPLGTGASQQLGDVALQHQALHWQQKCGLWVQGGDFSLSPHASALHLIWHAGLCVNLKFK